MANEFIIRKGFKSLQDSELTGSLNLSGNIVADGTVEASFASGTSTAISGAFDSVSSSLSSELLKNTTDTLTGDLTVTGTLTAQDLHVQEVTSSIVYSSGSNVFGSLNSHSHDFTGTINISRGGDRKLSFTDTRGGKVWTIEHDTNQIYLWNSTDSEAPIMFKNNGNVIMNAGSVGIGTDSTNAPLAVVGTGAGSVGTVNIKGSNAHLGFTSGSGTFRSWVGHFDTVGHGSEADLNIKTGYGTTGNIRFTADGDTTAAQMYLQGSSGHLGIGTTSPSHRLEIKGISTALTSDTNMRFFIDRSSASYLGSIIFTTGGASISNGWAEIGQTDANGDLYFKANASAASYDTRMIIKGSNGRVGIGTTSPAGDLEISGSGASLRTITFNPSFNDDISISSMGVDANNKNAVTIGQANSQNNSGVFRFHYDGAGSTNNYIGLGFYANDDLLKIQADGKVEIKGDTNSTAHLKFATVSGGSTNSYIGNFSGDLYLATNYFYDGGHNSDTASKRSMEYYMSDDVVQISTMPAGSPGTRTQVMFISGSQGYVGIGTNTPSGLLNVNTGASGTYDAIVLSRDTYGEAGVIKQAAGGLEVHSQKNLVLGADEDNTFTGTSSNIIFKVDGTTRGTFNSGGTLILGDGSNSGRLQFENDVSTRKVVLYQGANNDNEFYGFGIESNTLVYSVYTSSDDHVFFSGFSGGRNELMRIGGDGNVGIGTTSPGTKLTVADTATGDTRNLLLTNLNDTDGDSASLGFSMLANNTYVKGGIMFERTLNAGRGNLYLMTNSATDGTNVSKSDARLTVQHDGKIGINTTSPSSTLEVNGHVQTGQSLNVSGYSHLGQTNSGAMTILGHNARVDTSNNNRITATNNNWPASFIKMYYTQGISFHTTDTNQTAGDILLSGTGANSLERMRVTDDGITFNGDTAAANALDDYEEGTFTPVVGDGTYTYTNRRGHYVKIGNMVYVHIGFRLATASPGTSTASISGLPYTGINYGSYQEPHARIAVGGAFVTSNLSYNLSFYLSNSSSTLYARTSSGNADTPVASNAIWQAGTFIKYSLLYTVS